MCRKRNWAKSALIRPIIRAYWEIGFDKPADFVVDFEAAGNQRCQPETSRARIVSGANSDGIIFSETVNNSGMNRQHKITAGVEGRDKLKINRNVFFSFDRQTDRKSEHETVADIGCYAVSVPPSA